MRAGLCVRMAQWGCASPDGQSHSWREGAVNVERIPKIWVGPTHGGEVQSVGEVRSVGGTQAREGLQACMAVPAAEGPREDEASSSSLIVLLALRALATGSASQSPGLGYLSVLHCLSIVHSKASCLRRGCWCLLVRAWHGAATASLSPAVLCTKPPRDIDIMPDDQPAGSPCPTQHSLAFAHCLQARLPLHNVGVCAQPAGSLSPLNNSGVCALPVGSLFPMHH